MGVGAVDIPEVGRYGQGIPLANTTLTSTNFVLKELSWFWRIRSAD